MVERIEKVARTPQQGTDGNVLRQGPWVALDQSIDVFAKRDALSDQRIQVAGNFCPRIQAIPMIKSSWNYENAGKKSEDDVSKWQNVPVADAREAGAGDSGEKRTHYHGAEQ